MDQEPVGIYDTPQLLEYQEQPYLLDPFLESLVTPVVECLRNQVKTFVETKQPPEDTIRLRWVAEHMYQYIKFRGYKTICQCRLLQ